MPSYPTRSISPFIPRCVKFRAIITYPWRRKYQYAYVSPRTPVRRALCFAASREGGAAESDSPFRAAQSTHPNMTREKIGTAFPVLRRIGVRAIDAASFSALSVISVPSLLKALDELRKDF